MELPRGYISYNQIKLYRSCPRKYYYVYIEGLTTPIDDKIYTGIVVHKIIENYLQFKIDGGIPDVSSIIDLYNDTFEANEEGHEICWNRSRSKVKSRGISFIRYFIENIGVDIEPIMVEEELEAEIEGIPLRGILDLVEADHTLSDFKTARAKWSAKRVEHSSLQMYIYRYLLFKCKGINSEDLRFKILSSKNASSIRYQDVKLENIDKDFSLVGKSVKEVVDLICGENFSPRNGQLCKNCFFREGCTNS